jgi:hypothetical protein
MGARVRYCSRPPARLVVFVANQARGFCSLQVGLHLAYSKPTCAAASLAWPRPAWPRWPPRASGWREQRDPRRLTGNRRTLAKQQSWRGPSDPRGLHVSCCARTFRSTRHVAKEAFWQLARRSARDHVSIGRSARTSAPSRGAPTLWTRSALETLAALWPVADPFMLAVWAGARLPPWMFESLAAEAL